MLRQPAGAYDRLALKVQVRASQNPAVYFSRIYIREAARCASRPVPPAAWRPRCGQGWDI